MNLADLQARGACVDMSPVKRSVTWQHVDKKTGEPITDTFDVWVTRLSFGAIDRMGYARQSKRSQNAELIAACIRLGENAEEAIPYEVAYSLDEALAVELLRAASEVNKLRKQEATPSPKG